MLGNFSIGASLTRNLKSLCNVCDTFPLKAGDIRLAIMEKRSFLDWRPLVTQRHLEGEKKRQRERESDAGIGRGRRAGGGAVFTFESNSQLT
jgi:hypothetical protein